MTVPRIQEILIQVSDIRRSVKFYRDGLGIPLWSTGYGDDSFEGEVGSVRIVLHPDFDESMNQAPRGAGILIHLWVPDANAYHADLRRRGIPIAEEPHDRPWGRHFSVDDPDGYRIHILGPRKR